MKLPKCTKPGFTYIAIVQNSKMIAYGPIELCEWNKLNCVDYIELDNDLNIVPEFIQTYGPRAYFMQGYAQGIVEHFHNLL